MARRTLQASGRNYLFAPDDEPPLSSRWWGLVTARLINHVSGRPIGGQIRLESDINVTAPRIASDGVVGLMAIPDKVFPILARKNYILNLTIHAAGYLSRPKHPVVIPSVQTDIPRPKAGDQVIKLNMNTNFQIGEWLMIGNPFASPGSKFEVVRVATISAGGDQVTTSDALKDDHNANPEPVVPLLTDAGDIYLTPQP